MRTEEMGIREFLKEKQPLVVGVMTVVIILTVGFNIWRSTQNSLPTLNAKAFYSDDDGKTWFADEFAKPFPFDRNGKQAYAATISQCTGQEPKVAYLTRLTSDVLKLAQESYEKRDENWPMRFEAYQRDGLEIKRPGEDKWYPIESGPGQKIVDDGFTCPDGQPANVVTP